MKTGNIYYSLDFELLQKGEVQIVELEITGETTVTPEDSTHAPFEAYTYLSNGIEGKIAKDFADIKLKESKQDLIDEVKQDCEAYIVKCEEGLQAMKDSIELNKSIIEQLK